MIRATRRHRSVALGLAAFLALSALPAREAHARIACSDLSDLTTLFFQKHLRFHTLSPELRTRAAQNFIRRFDPQRVLFLESDIERLEDQLVESFSETRSGNCRPLSDIHQEVVGRSREVEGFVRGYVGGDDYELDSEVELILDSDKRGHPANTAERDELLRSLAHFQISNYLSNDASLDEARERLIHRYELLSKRVAELSRDDVYAAFLDSFGNALDPHSSYLSTEVFEDFKIQMELSLEGIGVALSERDGYSVVEQIIPGGAADQLDVLKPQDRIIAVAEDGGEAVDIIDMALRDVVRLIRGKKGTRVHLTVLRQEDTTERFHVAILRDKIDLEESAAKLEIREVEVEGGTLKLGVLDLPSFYGDGDRDPTKRQGSRDVRRLLAEAKEDGIDGLVVDLSRNGGGLLDDAVRISGFFIHKGGIVAVRDGADRGFVHDDPDPSIEFAGPLVILTSRVSASASEILAGALKDYDRAVVVGDSHTFGKGTVQSMIPLRPGLGALKVTTALFFRPGGESTQHDGVAADIVLPSLLTEDLVGESVHENSLPSDRTDPFLSARANATEQHWTPVDDETLAELRRRSAERVAEDSYFVGIEEKLAERAEDDGVVRLAEILEEQEKERTETPPEPDLGATASKPAAGDAAITPPENPADEDPEAPNPHLDEALRVLADLIQLQS